MPQTVFPEKRTRSQLELTDDIFQIPQGSPMKVAKTTVKSQPTNGASSSTELIVEDSEEDELLLSPKKTVEEKSQKPSSSKRSVSPEPHDEYSRAPRSPSKGRDPKRLKTDAHSEAHGFRESLANFAKRLKPRHLRHRSESNSTTSVQRLGRKRSATTSSKPLSTISLSPPPSTYSPPGSPKKGRAQSVPLFPQPQDVPRIDFRNPPPSPKRNKSPSRSPAKDKFRIEFGPFRNFTTLPTIQDEASNAMDLQEETTSVDEEKELPVIPSEPPITSIQLHPSTSDSSLLVKPYNSSHIHATPRTQLLNKLIPMSPLTPIPETPLPGRRLHADNERIQVNDNAIWGANILEESNQPPPSEQAGPSSVLLKPSATTVPDSAPKSSQLSAIPPPAVATTSNRPIKASTSKTTSFRQDAFEALMKGGSAAKAVVTGKASKSAKTGMKAPPQQQRLAFGRTKGKEKEKEKVAPVPPIGTGAGLGSRMKMKEKMKKREKVVQKTVQLVPMAEDEDEVQRESVEGSAADAPTSLGSKVVEEEREPLERNEDAVMESPTDSAKESQSEADKPVDAPKDDTAVAEPPLASTSNAAEPNPLEEEIEYTAMEAIQEPQDPSLVPVQESDVEKIASIEDAPRSSQDFPPNTPPLETSTTTTNPAADERAGFGPSVSMDNVMADPPTNGDEKPLPDRPIEAPAPRPAPSKLPLGKKRQPTAVVPANRVTRSISKRKEKEAEPQTSQAASRVPRRKAPASGSLKRTASGSVKKAESSSKSEAGPSSTVPPDTEGETEPVAPQLMDTEPISPVLSPGSPMRTSSPSRTPTTSPGTRQQGAGRMENDEGETIRVGPGRLSLAKSPTRASVKPASTPSPTKIARATSLFNKPTLTNISRTFSSDSAGPSTAGASLSTLSNALEKLRMPPPSRPNTSLGFNRETGDGDIAKPTTKDDAALNKPSSRSIPRPDGLKRSATLNSGSFSKNGEGSSTTKTGKNLIQKSLASFMAPKNGASGSGTRPGRGGAGASLNGKPIFGIGGPPRRMLSKKTPLPMVVGSPVKGGQSSAEDQDTTMETVVDKSDEKIVVGEGSSGDSNVFMAHANASTGALILEDLGGEGDGKGKQKEKSDASRRVSMLSHALSRSLSELPLALASSTNAKGSMGPPATPPSARLNGGSSDNVVAGSSDGDGPSSSPSQPGPSGTRSSSRIATKKANVVVPDAPISAGKKKSDDGAAAGPPKQETLKILNDCKIFVDVKTDDGDEAGSLFVEMLEGLGAKIMTRAGQTCTHVVYKNGLMSTITRYKLLRDPKPLLVSIGWVVECVEKREHVDETPFIVDVDDAAVPSNHKRRRSIMPKLFSDDPSDNTEFSEANDLGDDQSMDGSASSVTFEGDMALAPLERARRRRSMVVRP